MSDTYVAVPLDEYDELRELAKEAHSKRSYNDNFALHMKRFDDKFPLRR